MADGRRRAGTRAAPTLALAMVAVGLACSDPAARDAAPPRDGARSTLAASPTPEEIERLRALDYLDTAGPDEGNDPTKSGVVLHDEARAQPGYNLWNEQRGAAALLASLDGRVVHRFEDPGAKHWTRVELLPQGDLVAVGVRDRGQPRTEIRESDRFVARLRWDGTVRWRRSLGAHHDVEPLPDGSLLVLSRELRRIDAIDAVAATRDDTIVRVDALGSVVGRWSLYDLLSAGPFPFAFADVSAHLAETRELRRGRGGIARDDDAPGAWIDLIHANSIERLDPPRLLGSSPLHRRDSLLVTSRHQDTVAVVALDPPALRWAWGRGELSGPHDASWLANGNVLVFDNGLGRNWSRVVEVDPRSDEIVWEYRHPEPGAFYTASRGSAQRLANGNTLVTNSGAGQAFEVTREGEIVWEFWNPRVDALGRRATLGRMRRLDAAFVERLLDAQGAG